MADKLQANEELDITVSRYTNADAGRMTRLTLAKGDFDVALRENKSNFQAAFSFNNSYADIPNPALKLSDLGIVGLPLSTRDAEAIKSRSIQAPFGMGERTVVDKTVRDTWEMDAKLVCYALASASTAKLISHCAGLVCKSKVEPVPFWGRRRGVRNTWCQYCSQQAACRVVQVTAIRDRFPVSGTVSRTLSFSSPLFSFLPHVE